MIILYVLYAKILRMSITIYFNISQSPKIKNQIKKFLELKKLQI